MQVATNGVFAKTTRVLTQGVRNTSCNRGWLQLFTHIVCGTFTVTSFVFVLVITLRNPGLVSGPQESRCEHSNCRIICTEAPFYEQHEDDIVLAVMTAEKNCPQVFLTLHEPSFTNESLPQNWLPRLRPVVVEISIIGGNLHHIAHDAFSVAFARNLRILFLEDITIASWTQYTLLGLANLENIFIKDCNIIDLQTNVLSAVCQTLRAVTIIHSGRWDPKYLTGSTALPKLTTVDMSYNDFGDSLGETTFTKIKSCEALYLSSSRISYIAPGAFDNLVELQYLNLNDNLLTHLESGLFNVMTTNTPNVGINLVKNLWHCNCSNDEIRVLIKHGVLVVDPICHSPPNVRGKTFSEFFTYCKRIKPKRIVTIDMTLTANVDNDNRARIQSLTCISKMTPKFAPTVISPIQNYMCSINALNFSLFHRPSKVVEHYDIENTFWVKPIIIFKGGNLTMIELSISGKKGYGLIWYHNSCLNEVYCVNVMPDTIRLYNVDLKNSYKFCPVVLASGTVESAQCTDFISSDPESHSETKLLLLPLIIISVGCLLFGALIIYMLIRKYPYLLKGSKRLLFVKHKTVDALVLPPKLSLRGALIDQPIDIPKELFDTTASLRHDFKRSSSVRSGHSYAPSYISALQPTEEQLSEWRIKHSNERLDNHYSRISTISSDTSISLSSNSDHLYFSIEDVSPITSIIDLFSQNFEYETTMALEDLQSQRKTVLRATSLGPE